MGDDENYQGDQSDNESSADNEWSNQPREQPESYKSEFIIPQDQDDDKS